MSAKYKYGELTYDSEYAVRQAIYYDKRLAFGNEPPEGKEEFWKQYGVEYSEDKTEEERAFAKLARQKQVDKLVVKVDDMIFDADEESQHRISKVLTAAIALGLDFDTTTQKWRMADNTDHEPTLAQMAEALKMAVDAQTEIWFEYTPGEVNA